MRKYKEGDIVRLPAEKRREDGPEAYVPELIGEKVRVTALLSNYLYEVETLNKSDMDAVFEDEMVEVSLEETVKIMSQKQVDELANLEKDIEVSEEMLGHIEDQLDQMRERRDALKWGEE